VRARTEGQKPPQARLIEQKTASDATKVQEIGGLTGRLLLAWLATIVVSRQRLIRMFQIPGLVIMPLTFAWAATTSLSYLYVFIFLAGVCTVGQLSFWGNYLPRVYPVHLRGTGESFAANIGGRLIGTSFAWVTATLAVTPDRAYAPTKVALVAAGVGFSVYLVGFVASFFLPEPPQADLPE
jgi:sugar phosphate permease